MTRIASRGFFAGTSPTNEPTYFFDVAAVLGLLGGTGLAGHGVAGDGSLGAGSLEDHVAEHRHHPVGRVARDDALAGRPSRTRCEPTFSTRCGVTRTPPLPIVA